MGLKQSIVVVSEFSVKTKSGGSRGGTPGDYVLRYMARDKAVEDLTPVRLEDTDTYIRRYMMREEATEQMDSVPKIKKAMYDAQKMGGVAFGYGEVSLSDRKVRQASRDIQRNFDSGHTVIKTVLSFDEEYLRQTGIIPSDFYLEKKGDFRGNVDQLKLRLAIMNGLDKMGRNFDDLQYVGVIQVDTAHLHCHIAMVDRGRGKLMPDGTQRGKLSAKNMRDLRRGIDMYLDNQKSIQYMSSNITTDRRNALCFIKRYTHKVMDLNGGPQFLLSVLPDDKRLWRASTNRQEMRKANYIVRDFVTRVLEEPDSGFKEAMRDVADYAQKRMEREDLTGEEYRRLVDSGRERIIEDCMNGVYSVLKQVPENQKQIRTPMLDIMSMDYEDMAKVESDDPIVEFGFKLRSYSSRLDYHKKEHRKYKEAVKTYESTENVSADSKPLYDFLRFESDYNAMLMSKYQHFLAFLPRRDDYEDDFEELMEYKSKKRRLEKMRNDKSMQRIQKPEDQEDYGLRVYDMHGGRFATMAPQILEARQAAMDLTYQQMEDDFREKLAYYGLSFDGNGVTAKNPYEFDDVKALDLHHLAFDFPYDAMISKPNADRFVETARKRYSLYQGAKEYLEQSGQPEGVAQFNERDIHLMKDVADRISQEPVIISQKPTGGGKRKRSRTISLDRDYRQSIEMAVKSTIQSIQLEKS